MWSPTHVQVTVYRAKNLILKGKSGTNDAYVTIKLGDEKYQTSIKERSVDPDWMEECDLPLTDPHGVVHLNVYHRNLLGIDEFLGHLDIPLEDFNIYDRPRSRWYALRNKTSSKKPEKYRGEIEVKITFIVQSVTGSQASLTKKGSFKRSSSIKTLAQSVGEKLTKNWPSKGSLTLSGSRPDLSSANSDTGDYSPTVRKVDKKGLTRSHTILPTSYNNQHLQEEQQSHDEVDSVKTEEVKGQDFDRWQNVGHGTAVHDDVRGMDIVWYYGSHDGSTVDASNSEPPIEDVDDEDLAQMRHRPLLAKSMFDLSTPSFDELAVVPKDTSRNTQSEDVKDQSLCYISSSESDLNASAESSPKKQIDRTTPSADGQTAEKIDHHQPNTPGESSGQLKRAESDQSLSDVKERKANTGEERQRDRVEKYKKMKDVNRRHTLQYGRHNVPRATAHDLHEGIMEYQQRALESRDRDLPSEIVEQFNDKSREDLIRIVLELNTQLHKKEQYNRDLENYIDNLLVKVMEVTPKLLQHPNSRSPSHSAASGLNRNITNGVSSYGTAPRSMARKPMAPAAATSPRKERIVQSDNVNNSNNRINNADFIQQNNRTNKKPFNPFKKLQQALK